MDAVRSRFIDLRPALSEELDSVPPTTSFAPEFQRVSPEGPRQDLAYIRSRFPFVPIMPVPDDVVSIVCAVANQAYQLPLPDGTTIVRLAGDGQDYWVNFEHQFITLANMNNPTSDALRNQSLFRPDYSYFYTGKLTELSVGSATPNRVVQAACWITKVRP